MDLTCQPVHLVSLENYFSDHPSWSSIILKSTSPITRCCFFFLWCMYLELYWPVSTDKLRYVYAWKTISWSYSLCCLCISLSFPPYVVPYLTPKCYWCRIEEFMFRNLIALKLLVFLSHAIRRWLIIKSAMMAVMDTHPSRCCQGVFGCNDVIG